ncbi:hypothetical protein KIN20_005866 [Parelaphostrongylus tenuis]|uniref:Tudor domain-containing protein n=1 Tax=Parelaphostrongylus tenuis TaxID=148309 RepID=A0AAD5MTC1_PARTN|nr:hypothetical protein KIN20_005866 [Parelaphostrongylus tenuis]
MKHMNYLVCVKTCTQQFQTVEKKREKLSEVDYHLAQKIEYLLSNFPEGLSVREIAVRLGIRETDGLTPNAQASNCMRGKEDGSSKWPKPIKTSMLPCFLFLLQCKYVVNIEFNVLRVLDNSDDSYFDALGRNTLTHANSPSSEDCRSSPGPLLNKYRRRLSRAPYEPRKFQAKFLSLPSRERVRLTHFITLQEFYVRSCYDDSAYRSMLEDLSNDYKGAMEDSNWPMWIKGDGAAVFYDRTWQRCVVSTPVQNSV